MEVARLFNELGWDCVTSRSESKRRDDLGIDLCYTAPFAVQCKATETAPNFHTVLDGMPATDEINVIFHKRKRRGSVVVLRERDFVRLLKMMIEGGVIKAGG